MIIIIIIITTTTTTITIIIIIIIIIIIADNQPGLKRVTLWLRAEFLSPNLVLTLGGDKRNLSRHNLSISSVSNYL